MWHPLINSLNIILNKIATCSIRVLPLMSYHFNLLQNVFGYYSKGLPVNVELVKILTIFELSPGRSLRLPARTRNSRLFMDTSSATPVSSIVTPQIVSPLLALI